MQRRPEYSQQELLRVFLRTDFYAFVQKVFETVNPGLPFSRNWSTEAVTHALQQVVTDETTRLIINIPPRNLKSICASVALPAFLLGHTRVCTENLNSNISVMKAAKDRARTDDSSSLNWARERGIFVQ